jgi:uncharacterized protein
MTGRLALIHQHRDTILAMARQYGVEGLRVFGSVARGEDGPDSHVDFLITGMATGRDLIDFIEFKNDLEQFFGHRVDVLFQNGLYWYVRDRILAEAVTL